MGKRPPMRGQGLALFCTLVATATIAWTSLVAVVPATAATHTLLFSISPDRANPVPLDSATVAGNIYAFTNPDAGVTRVRFFLDNPGMTGTPRQTENTAPFDFAGGTAALASPFDTRKLADGNHVITAAIDLTGGSEVVSATFIVANKPPALAWSPSSLTLSVPSGGSTSGQVTLGATTGTASFTLTEEASWLTASPTTGATPGSITLTVNAAGLAPGTYTTNVTAAAAGYVSSALTVTLVNGETTGGGQNLLLSASANRASPGPLQGASVAGNIYVFTTDTGVKRVRFFLDDPGMTKTPRQTENGAPFDFAGTATSGAAQPFNTTQVSDGSHVITAAVDLVSGGTQVLSSSFIVANNAPSLAWSPDAVTLSVPEGGRASSQVNLNSAGGVAAFTVAENASWLAVSPTSGSTPASVTLAFDAAGLAPAVYTSVVTASAPGFVSDQLTVTVTVGTPAPPDQVHLAWVGDPSTTIVVVWRTLDALTPSLVEYRRPGEAAWRTAIGAPRPSGTVGTLHEVTLTSLSPSTTYEYRVPGDHGLWSPTFTTRTAPPRGPADFEVVYLADTGINGRLDGLTSGTQQVIEEIVALDPLAILLGGDYAYFDTDKRFGSLDATIDAWFDQMQPIGTRSPLMPAYGNHEVLLGEGYQAWAARFPTPPGFDNRRHYSFDIGDVHFVSILAAAETTGLSTGVLAWIEQDIIQALDAGQRWIVPYLHVSPFSDGANHPSNLTLRAQLGPLFERLGVKLVLSSHDQSFERTYPLVDVPATNTPTSAARGCYTMADGVTWVKVSPGGKLSNKNGWFSQFRTQPPPPWTAVRDNSLHHFARLSVRASGTIQVETYGVVGDGSPLIVQDRFLYTLGACPPELSFSPRHVVLTAPVAGTATTAVDLDVDGTGASEAFTLTSGASWLSAEPVTGMTPTQLIVSGDATGLAPGSYRATLTAEAQGAVSDSLDVTLTVVSDQYALLVSTQPNRSNPLPLEAASVAGNIYVFTSPDSGVRRVRFYLDNPGMVGSPRQIENNAPFDFASGTVSLANPFDTSKIARGVHSITAAMELLSGAVQVVTATFVVSDTP